MSLLFKLWTPALIQTGSGGTTYDESMSIDAEILVNNTNIAIMENALSLAVISTIVQDSIMTIAGSIIIAGILNDTIDNNAVIENTTSVQLNLGISDNNIMTMDASTLLSGLLTVLGSNTAIMDEQQIMAVSTLLAQIGGLESNDAVALALSGTLEGSGNLIVSEGVSMNTGAGVSDGGNINMEQIYLLGSILVGAFNANTAMNEQATLAASALVNTIGGLELNDSATLTAHAFVSSGEMVTVDTSLILAQNVHIDETSLVNFEINLLIAGRMTILNLNNVVVEDGLALASNLAASAAFAVSGNIDMKVIAHDMDISVYIRMA